MMVTILQWLAIPLVKWGVTALGVAAVFGLWLWKHDAKVAQRAEQAVINQSIEAGKKANEEADKAHDAAARPGAAGRLLKSSCRDCQK